eukprot:Partr_v1_DN28186_c1_g2_i6_m55301
MWSYNFDTSRWTFLSGTSANSPLAVAGSRGQWSTEFYPKGRYHHGIVFDSVYNIVYLRGGAAQSPSPALDDVWAFKRETLEWAFLSGESTSFSPAVYGQRGQSSPLNTPGSRAGPQIVFHEYSGLLFLFGGYFGGPSFYGTFNSDFWAYNTSSYEWTWVSGPTVTSVDGTFSGSNSYPSAVYMCALTVDPATDEIYMFGGDYDNNAVADHMWRINIDSAPRSARSYFTSDAQSLKIVSTVTTSISTSPVTTSISTSPAKSISTSPVTTSISNSPVTTSISNSIATRTSYTNLPAKGATPNTVGSDILSPSLSLAVESDQIISSNINIILSSNSSKRRANSGVDVTSRTTPPPGEKLGKTVRSAISNNRLLFYVILVLVSLVAVLIVVITLQCNGKRLIKQNNVTTASSFSGFTESSTLASFSESKSKQSSTSFTTETAFSATEGLYLPGGLRVIASTAYRVEQEIAKGGGGSVWLATAFEQELAKFGTAVIVKIPNFPAMNDRQVALFHQEISLMHAFSRQPNIAKLLGYTDDPYSMILKYYQYGSLKNWINAGNQSIRQSTAFIKDIAWGITALHNYGVAHCDLKPDNILIDRGTRLFAVIADFGIARIVTDKLLKVASYQVQRINGASIPFAAPEAIKELRLGVNMKASAKEIMARDIYGLGMIIKSLLECRDVWSK